MKTREELAKGHKHPCHIIIVMAGLVPAISINRAPSFANRYHRDKPGNDTDEGLYLADKKSAYASPAVSNIAALMASFALFPAQTTNCSAGK